MPQLQVQHHPKAPEGGKNFGAFQREIYINGVKNSILPIVTTDPNKLEAQAREHLGVRSYSYVAGGAGERATMDANRLAFRQWKVCLHMSFHLPNNCHILTHCEVDTANVT